MSAQEHWTHADSAELCDHPTEPYAAKAGDDTQTLTFQGPARLAALHLIDNTCLSYLAHTNGSTIGGGPLSLTDWGTTLEVEVRRSWSWSKGEEVLLDIMRRFSETSWSLLDEKTQRVALTALLLSCGKTAEGLVAAR